MIGFIRCPGKKKKNIAMVVICILTAEKSIWPDAPPYAVSPVLIYAGALSIQKV